MGGQHYIPADLPLGKSPVTPCTGGWVGFVTGLKGVRGIWLSSTFEPKIVQAVESGSTYCFIPDAGNTVYILTKNVKLSRNRPEQAQRGLGS